MGIRLVFSIIGAVVLAAGFMLGAAFPALGQGPASVSDLAARLSGAVVNISTSRLLAGEAGDPFPELPPGSPLREMFDELNPNSGQGEERMREARSLGSGFLISAQGLIITNNHVIEGADEILIFTVAGDRYVAELVGADAKTDLAVLKVSADDPFPFVAFGNSDTAEVGDWVMAIGNPFGLGGSVSLGIVSARNRDISAGPYDDFIQTDAAINLGNSGGPLFDMNGDVVGIVTAIIARGGNSRGIGFAVPANLARPVIDQLVTYGETRRGWLGVGIQDVSEEMARSAGLSAPAGALVVEVTPGGPSEGILQAGDIILHFDGVPVIEMRDLPRLVAQMPVGESVTVQVVRDGETKYLPVELGRLEVGERLVAEARIEGLSGNAPGLALPQDLEQMLGFTVLSLTPELLEHVGRGRGVRGVFVNDVVRESRAFAAGLRSGLVILEVEGVEIASVAEFEAAIRDMLEREREQVEFRVSDTSGLKYYIVLGLDG